ncbi:MAG: hypothetical protein Q8O43_10390 [Dehalococcoidia bacterium]|nr:hypothetical protein [Dehalococcoidia bacterium]
MENQLTAPAHPTIPIRKNVLIGSVAGIALLLFYGGLLSALQGPAHALQEAIRLWYWLVLLATGFGIQIGLYSFIRDTLKQRRKAATASSVVSGGISAGAMVACCAHHLADIAPLLGLVAVTSFFTGYQTIFMLTGVLTNAVGILIQLETIQRHGLCLRVSGLRWDIRQVRNMAIIIAAVVVLTAVLVKVF